jgi:arylformamidase
MSIEGPHSDGRVHRTLLSADILIIEGLELRGIEPGEYTLIALPLPLEGADASPCRAVLARCG